MDTTTLVVLVAVAVLALAAGGYYLLARSRGQRRARDEAYSHFRCRGCGRRLRYQARQAGHKGKCSNCGQEVTFPPSGRSAE